MVNIDPTITVGNLIELIGFTIGLVTTGIGVYIAVSKRLTVFESVLNNHAATLTNHSAKMEKQDDRFLVIIGDIQRLFGNMQAFQTMLLSETAMRTGARTLGDPRS